MDVDAEREKITQEIKELERILDPSSTGTHVEISESSLESDSEAAPEPAGCVCTLGSSPSRVWPWPPLACAGLLEWTILGGGGEPGAHRWQPGQSMPDGHHSSHPQHLFSSHAPLPMCSPSQCPPHPMCSPPHALPSPRAPLPTRSPPHALSSPCAPFPMCSLPHVLPTPCAPHPTASPPHSVSSPRAPLHAAFIF
ncbi:hypothetical protein H8959_012076 [Pygathrix nigripes]